MNPLLVWWLYVLPIALAMPIVLIDQWDDWSAP
jgi:hypothetical protein